MDFTVGAGLLFTAGALGVTHGIEPDHVAGITALTHEASDPKLSALVGGCFAAGHAVLVVLWIALAYLLVGTTSFPAVFDRIGMLFVGILLALLSLYLGITGARKLLHKHGHDHGDGPHAHYHLHLPASIVPSRTDHEDGGGDHERVHSGHEPVNDGQERVPGDVEHDHGAHEHDHGVIQYLKVGTVGAFFTLSPPISMIAFISVAMSDSGPTQLVGVVAVYSVAIIATMAAVGGGAGTLFRLSKAKGERVHAVSQVVASVLVLAFAINVLVGVVPALLS